MVARSKTLAYRGQYSGLNSSLPRRRSKVTNPVFRLERFPKAGRSYRKWCKTCGGHLLTDHPEWKLVDVYAATTPEFPFKPGVHVNYAQTVLPMKDGLPKLKDFPPELGGTGQSVPE